MISHLFGVSFPRIILFLSLVFALITKFCGAFLRCDERYGRRVCCRRTLASRSVSIDVGIDLVDDRGSTLPGKP